MGAIEAIAARHAHSVLMRLVHIVHKNSEVRLTPHGMAAVFFRLICPLIYAELVSARKRRGADRWRTWS
jgi:hypothetical protein